jgi:hypothetical protein
MVGRGLPTHDVDFDAWPRAMMFNTLEPLDEF